MAAFFTESFTGSPTSLDAYGNGWAKQSGYTSNISINGGVAYFSANPAGNGGAYANSATPPSADYSVSADITFESSQTGTNLIGVCGRMASGAATLYHAQYNEVAGAWRLWKQVAGTFTQLGSDVSQTLTIGQTYNIKLEMIGTAIKLYRDGTVLISATDSAITAAGSAGIRINRSGGTLDNAHGFVLDNFVADAGSAGNTVAVPAGALTLAGLVPAVSATANQVIAAPLATLALAGQAPSIVATANQVVAVPAAALAATPLAPTIAAGAAQTIAVPVGTLALSAQAPAINSGAGQSVAVPAAVMSLTGFVPVVNATAARAVNPPPLAMLLVAWPPLVNNGAPMNLTTDDDFVAVAVGRRFAVCAAGRDFAVEAARRAFIAEATGRHFITQAAGRRFTVH
jgi:hypothetical protein